MPPTFTCIIIDDEPKAIILLRELLVKSFGNVEVIGEFTRVNAAIEALNNRNCDLLLMDIAMPVANGFALLYSLPALKSEVIFITAHPEYALDAHHFAPTGYILKPVNEEELTMAIHKALERIMDKRMD